MSKHSKNGNQAESSAELDSCTETLEAAKEHAEASRERMERDAIYLAEKDARIAELENELADQKDQYLRKLADYENFRKRMYREKDDAIQYANTKILEDIAGILDDFERAIKSTEISQDFKALHDGVDMIRKNMSSIMENKYGLSRIESVGLVFDPNVHEAMMTHKGECEEPTVSEEFQAGYRLKERVLRPAKVKVMMPEERNSPDKGAASASQDFL